MTNFMIITKNIQYLDKRVRKIYSLVIIIVQLDDHTENILKHCSYILEQYRKMNKLLRAKLMDQCSIGHQFG
jgi:hypothetical protein